jgi:hypothetical protein
MQAQLCLSVKRNDAGRGGEVTLVVDYQELFIQL